jgi:GDP-L-fucose synthase
MVGSAISRVLRGLGFLNVLETDRSDTDLTDGNAVGTLFSKTKPEFVFFSAARVGGIMANKMYPAEFLEQNLRIQLNVMRSAYDSGIKKMCFFGSSCMYPRLCPQPMREDYLLQGSFEPTNEGYALAKVSGLKLLEYYHRQYGFESVTVVPCNLYGTNDHFDFESAHVLSALVRRFVDARDAGDSSVVVWGTGQARREFMHVDDAAELAVELMGRADAPRMINIGPGTDVSISELAQLISQAVGFSGEVVFDVSKPDGMPRKCMDVSRMRELAIRPKISLEEGIRRTVAEYSELKKVIV